MYNCIEINMFGGLLMSRLSVLFADDFEDVSKRFCEFCDLGFDYRTCEKDGSIVLEELVKNPVDVLVIDIFMNGLDAFGVLERLKKLNPLITPAVIVLSSVDNPTIKNEFIKNGASFYLKRPVKTELLISKIKEIQKNREINGLPSNATIYRDFCDTIITDYIQEFCIPAHIKGYKYLRYGIKMSVENPQLLGGMTTRLYPLIAEKYDVSSASVERTIRSAIETAWERGSMEAFSKYFGYNSQIRRKHPTNAEFIARFTDEIRIKYNIS